MASSIPIVVWVVVAIIVFSLVDSLFILFIYLSRKKQTPKKPEETPFIVNIETQDTVIARDTVNQTKEDSSSSLIDIPQYMQDAIFLQPQFNSSGTISTIQNEQENYFNNQKEVYFVTDLPLNEPIISRIITNIFYPARATVVNDYRSIDPSHLNIRKGDEIQIKKHLNGYCFGYNLQTRKNGSFPLNCILKTKLVLMPTETNSTELINKTKQMLPNMFFISEFTNGLDGAYFLCGSSKFVGRMKRHIDGNVQVVSRDFLL
ncbi:hypothetical protein HDV04_004967 [Boothiomyces sp. JEL0838]|nr:hypothetical protein HDV04_004967 [Boothiomyces sp. JEL0838]